MPINRVLYAASKIARWVAIGFTILIFMSLFHTLYSLWSRQRQLEWQVEHPVQGTDVQHLQHYLPNLTGVEACEWVEGLRGGEGRYYKAFSGFARLTPQQMEALLTETRWEPRPGYRLTPYDRTSFLTKQPLIWHAPSAIPKPLIPIAGYHGTYFLEKTNRVIRFIFVTGN